MRLAVSEDFLGAVSSSGDARFRVWAPTAHRVEVVFEGDAAAALPLQRADDGYFSGSARSCPSLYKYRVDGDGPCPDPCSRFQPSGVHGPSLIVDPTAFEWHDAQWHGAKMHGQVLYELHVGTFTPAGTFDAAADKLVYLRDLGITMIELMPIAECPGRWNWGYDGVQLYAPYHVYGDHDALKRFVDRAHALGLAVILDVVYNHLGPDGNYLKRFSPHYFSTRYKTEWGEALNFDAEHALGARDFVLHNVRYWIREFHLDGFRLDATQSIFDDSRPHVLAELTRAARAAAAPRDIVLIAENEPQCAEHLLPADRGGFDLDAMWNDDFHHAARVALTGRRDGYFSDYTGRSQELLSCIRRGFLYQGQFYQWQKQPRGSPPAQVPASSFVVYLQNHDQVANSFIGERVHAHVSAAQYRALAALTLLAPQTPLLFMGQEFNASTRFMFFADHRRELAELVHAGRRDFVKQFRAYADPAAQALIPDPAAAATFESSKLEWSELIRHAPALRFHRELLRLRAADPVISRQSFDILDGATLSERALVLRWFDAEHGDRLLLVNWGDDLRLQPAAEPLLAPPRDARWKLAWCSEDTCYGGHGIVPPVTDGGRGPWQLAGHGAALLCAQYRQQEVAP
jgi:maltooligosyltrehalose trehalohydrolase